MWFDRSTITPKVRINYQLCAVMVAYYVRASDESERTRKLRQQELSDVIIETLRRHPELCYFQGFHDIIQVMLLALGKEVAADVVPYLSLLRLRDFMLPSLTATTSQLELIPAILYTSDVELSRLVSLKQLPDPHFAISSILTLYAHNVKSYDEITRLFDFLFAHDAVISLYLFVVVIISRREELLAIDDIDELNVKLSKLPTPLDLEYLISNTTKLFARHPPESLPFRAWSRVSPRSVLKTTRKCLQGSNQGIDPQRLVIAEDLFASHAAQIQRQEFRAKIRKNMAHTIRRYRRPAGSIGLAILIGVVSIWAQRSGIGGVWSGPNEILWSFLGMRDIRQQFWGQQNLRT